MNKGSKKYFDIDWKNRKEKTNHYFTKSDPKTQLQLAFKNHYEEFMKICGWIKKGKSLEVGCGRGNMSLYFANGNWNTFLLDQSESAIHAAKENFRKNGFDSFFHVGDAEKMLYDDNTFDCTFSIGLLEHFKNPKKVIEEQYRVLKHGGIFIGYVVPEKFSVQTLAKPLNYLLSKFKKFIDPEVDNFKPKKEELYRNTYSSEYYLKLMKDFAVTDSFGIFPVPSFSYSEIYPFTPLPEKLEKTAVLIQKMILKIRSYFSWNPWRCSERTGQAFVVWGIKK